MGGFAWVTLATNDSYSLGALVLAHSLKRAGTKHDLAVLITPGVTDVMREKLSSVFSLVQEVNVLDSKDEANLALLARPELGITFTKLHCWRLTQYEKCVFVDADALVVRNCDELFERQELSAAPDVGWPDCFNSGVFVFEPSQQTFASLTAFAMSKGSFDGGDQGLLNSFFSDWAHKDISKHLPFIYNMCSTATYSYLPAYKQFGEDVRIIHFIGGTKPWLQYFDTLTGQVQPAQGTGHLQPLLQHWWDIFCENVHPELSPVMAGIAGALAKITLGEMRSPEQVALEEHMRKYGWEQGKIDYMGRDSFDNIWKKISTTLEISPAGTTSEKTLLEEKPASPGTKKSPTLEKTVDEITEKKTKVDEAVTEQNPRQKQDIIMESQQDKIDHETQAQPTSPTVLALKAAPSILSIKHSGEKSQRTFEYQPISKEEDDEPSTPTPGSVIPLGFTTSPTFETTTSLNLATDEKETEIPERPAPIQRALSIVEAEIKESVTEDIKPVTGQVFSSISASPEDPISAVSVDPPMPIETSIPSQPNGNTDHDYDSISDQEEAIPQSVARNSGLLRRVAPFGASSEVASADAAPIEKTTTSTLEKVPEIPVEESGGSVREVFSNVPEVAAEVKLTSEQIPKVPISTGETSGAQFDTKQFSSGTIESKTQIPEVEGKTEELEAAEQVPVKPVRTKDIKIPATPTVTEATPPTSPQFETSGDEAKPIMKVVDKTESEDKAESEEQKMTKKVGKKVDKNLKDDVLDDSEEAKKNVKTVEDPAEPGQSLEPDTSVPETPPPPSSGIPVPPKRKTKPSTMKTPTKDK